jgi:hypothetical protein
MHGWTQLPSHPILRMQPPPPPLGILHYTIKSMGGFGRTCAVILQACQRETFCSWELPIRERKEPGAHYSHQGLCPWWPRLPGKQLLGTCLAGSPTKYAFYST